MLDRETANENAGSRSIGVPVALQCGSQSLDRRFDCRYLKTIPVRLIMMDLSKILTSELAAAGTLLATSLNDL